MPAIFLKFAAVPRSVTLFTQMSQAVHGLVSQPVFRLGQGCSNGVVVSAPDPRTADWSGVTVVWMTAVILMSPCSCWDMAGFFVDALWYGAALHYLLLTPQALHWGEPESVGTRLPYKRTRNSRANSWKRSDTDPDNSASRRFTLSMAAILARHGGAELGATAKTN